MIRRNDGTSETFYFANDHLGSVDAVLNASGAVVSRPSFNAWGARRGANWQGAPSPSEWQAIADTTRRGYTGHEQLDNVMLVHMNGRVYDPAIGRFPSADPFIDCAQDLAGWNRYSYVKNNPLAFTDPRGFSRLPPSPALQRVDPGLNGLENIVVEGSRLEPIWESLRASLALNFYVTTTVGSTAAGGGGGQSGGDGAKQREDEHKKCVMDCVESKTPEIYGLAAMAGALPTRNPYVVAGAGVVGYLAGQAKIRDQSPVGPGIVGAMAGHVLAMFDNRPTVAGVVTAPLSAIGADVVGNSFDGPSGAFWGGAAGGAIDSLPAVSSLLGEGAVRAAVIKLFVGAGGPAATAYAGYFLATYAATKVCESDCSGQ